MSSLFSRLRSARCPTGLEKRATHSHRFVKPRLESLEDRTVLDAMVFVGIGTPTVPALWNVIGNWSDLSGGAGHIPNANDEVGIPGTAGTVLLTGQNADINSIVTLAGSNLIIDSGIELKINSNPPTNPPAGMPTSPNARHNYFGGFVTDPGRINLSWKNGVSSFFSLAFAFGKA